MTPREKVLTSLIFTLLPAYRGIELRQCSSFWPGHRTVQTGSKDCGGQDGGPGQWCHEYHPGNGNNVWSRMEYNVAASQNHLWLSFFSFGQDRYGSYWGMERSDPHLSDEKDLVQARAEREPVSWVTLAYPTDEMDPADRSVFEVTRQLWKSDILVIHCLRTIIRREAVLVFSQARLWNLDFKMSLRWKLLYFIHKNMVLILLSCDYFYLVIEIENYPFCFSNSRKKHEVPLPRFSSKHLFCSRHRQARS